VVFLCKIFILSCEFTIKALSLFPSVAQDSTRQLHDLKINLARGNLFMKIKEFKTFKPIMQAYHARAHL
jgi:hypothetical protein